MTSSKRIYYLNCAIVAFFIVLGFLLGLAVAGIIHGEPLSGFFGVLGFSFSIFPLLMVRKNIMREQEVCGNG